MNIKSEQLYEEFSDRKIIIKHIEKYIGKVDSVNVQIVPDVLSHGIAIIKPTDKEPDFTLVTLGVSDIKMKLPHKDYNIEYVELIIHLNRNWNIDDKNSYWPFKLLRDIGGIPYYNETHLAQFQTISNDEKNTPYAPNTKLCSSILLMPHQGKDNEAFDSLSTHPNKKIHFLHVFPLYIEELNLVLNNERHILFKNMMKMNYGSEIIINRPNYASII